VSTWDCVVVGGGIAGSVVARRLVESGRRVLVVESGRPLSEPPGQHVRNSPPFCDDPDGYFAAIDPLFDYVDRDVGPAHLPGAFTTGIDGGMGIVWTNNCPRAVAGLDRPDVLDDDRWGECYRVAERHLGVRSDLFDDSARAGFVVERLAAILAAQGRQLDPLPLAGQREGPERIRYTGPADIVAPAAGIERRRGEVESVEIDAGAAHAVVVDGARWEAAQVVIAAGALGTPALLVRSRLHHPALGHHLSYHPVLLVRSGRQWARPASPGPEVGLPVHSDVARSSL
jgi:glycine/D-amino acid oxidase-like deaminating enzyme